MSLTTVKLQRPKNAPKCEPRWATKRNHDRPTLGPRVAQVAEILGFDLMPWQRQVLDIALEVDPETGRLVYREIRLTVPRQSGKTTLLLSLLTHRCIGFGERQRAVFTMQTRMDARQKLFEDYKPLIEKSSIGKKVGFRESSGSERLTFPNGSIWGLVSSNEKSGHGPTVDLGVLDEAFAQEDDRFEQGLKPSQITRGSAQFWIVSTMGTNTSHYFNGKVKHGRESVEQGVDSGVAYFEWSAPEDCDPADHDVWYRCMPALGITVPIESVQADFESMKAEEFKRAYLNIMHDKTKVAGWSVLSKPQWEDVADATSVLKPKARFTVGVDTSPDRGYSSISIAGDRKLGGKQVELVRGDIGTEWRFKKLLAMHKKHGERMRFVVIDKKSQASDLIDPLQEAGVPVKLYGLPEHARAAGAFYDGVKEGMLFHRGQSRLTVAVQGAGQRKYGDLWLWDRRGSVDITPLVSATLAHDGQCLPEEEDDDGPIFAY